MSSTINELISLYKNGIISGSALDNALNVLEQENL